MPRGRPKKEEKLKEEEPKEKIESKDSEETITLIMFKERENMSNITYAGFKASLKADHGTPYPLSDLEKEFSKYQARKSFIKK